MKLKIAHWLTALLCTVLFYKQSLGLNMALFGIALILISLFLKPHSRFSIGWASALGGLLISSFSVMLYSGSLGITMSILSFLALLIMNKYRHSSLISALGTGFASVFVPVLFMVFDTMLIRQFRKRKGASSKKKHRNWFAILAIVPVIGLFLFIYSLINPVFNTYISGAFETVNFFWLLFFLFSAYFLYTFFFTPRVYRPFLRYDYKRTKSIIGFQEKWNNQSSFFDNEKLSAVLLFIVLNVMILLMNITDFNYVVLKSQLPEGVTHAEYIHNSVGMVIFSIICAIGLILFYFRGRMNYAASSKLVKNLSYLWLIQNAVLIVMAIMKNEQYISDYSLTYKRIGVYFYLSFSIIGLLFTAYKIYAKRGIWFLFSANSLVIFISLNIASLFNWNHIVSSYNINKGSDVDFYYLEKLGHENFQLLWEHDGFKSYLDYRYELKLTGETQLYYLPEAVGSFLEDYHDNSFQSYCYTKSKIYEYFKEKAIKGELKTKEIPVAK